MKRHNVRRLLALVLVAALCLLCGAAAQPNAKEIHIYSADDLVQLSKSCKLDTYSQGKTVYLDNDVDLSGSDFVPIPTFGGMFEGQGHTVSGLELSGDASHMGLFRYVQAVGTVRDLKITGNIDAAGTLNEIGAVVGTNYGTISGCSFNGTISGENNVGGIAGTNESSGMIYNCKTEGFVEGDHYVGGIVGQNIGTISYCSNTTGVNINASEAVDSAEDLDSLTLPTASDDEDDDAPKKANTSTDVGGICGFSSGVIIGCTNWGGVGFEHVGYNIGGIVGRQSGLVSGCTNWGTASGRKDVGGICGQLEPFITLDVESGSIGAMAKELNTLHDQPHGRCSVVPGRHGRRAQRQRGPRHGERALCGRAHHGLRGQHGLDRQRSVHPHQHGGENARSRDHGVFHGGRVARQGDRLLQQGL